LIEFLFALIFNLFISRFFSHFSNQSSPKSLIFDYLPIVKDELDVYGVVGDFGFQTLMFGFEISSQNLNIFASIAFH